MSFAVIAIGTAGASVLGGAAQTIFSGKGKAQKQLEDTANSSPVYTGSKPIADYYNEAKARYSVSPYQSNQYQLAKQNAERNTASTLNSLQSRGGAMGSVGKIVGLQNDALLKAGAVAENEQNQRFGQLGGATQMQSADDLRKFQINQLDPYNRKFNLASMKSSAANARFDAGLSNIFNGLGNAGMAAGIKKRPPANIYSTTNADLY